MFGLGLFINFILLVATGVPFLILIANFIYRLTGHNKHQRIGKLLIWLIISAIAFTVILYSTITYEEA